VVCNTTRGVCGHRAHAVLRKPCVVLCARCFRQTRELALLCILAAVSGMLAWALDRPSFVPLFVAEATYLAVYLSNPDRLK
jgi:hypothetical protein